MAITDASLERSKNAQLDVQLECSIPDSWDLKHHTADANAIQSIALLSMLLKHRRRIRQLHLFVDCAALERPEFVNHIRDFSAPDLQSLTLCLLSARSNRKPGAKVSRKRFPNLKKIRLCYITISPTARFTGLTHICIEAYFDNLRSLISVIHANRDLEEVILINHGDESFQSLTMPVIESPRLRWVSLCSLPPLLDHIRITSQRHSIRLKYDELRSSAFSFSSPLLKLAINGSAGIGFTTWNNDNHVQITSELHPKALSPDMHRPKQDLNLLLREASKNLSAFSTVQELWLSKCHSPDRTPRWRIILDSMPLLTSIFVAPGPANFILISLTPDEDTSDVLCRGLQAVHIRGTKSAPNKLLEMVERRARCGFRLQKLHIYYNAEINSRVVEQMKLHVDEVLVTVNPLWGMPQMDIPREFTEYRHECWKELSNSIE